MSPPLTSNERYWIVLAFAVALIVNFSQGAPDFTNADRPWWFVFQSLAGMAALFIGIPIGIARIKSETH